MSRVYCLCDFKKNESWMKFVSQKRGEMRWEATYTKGIEIKIDIHSLFAFTLSIRNSNKKVKKRYKRISSTLSSRLTFYLFTVPFTLLAFIFLLLVQILFYIFMCLPFWMERKEILFEKFITYWILWTFLLCCVCVICLRDEVFVRFFQGLFWAICGVV